MFTFNNRRITTLATFGLILACTQVVAAKDSIVMYLGTRDNGKPKGFFVLKGGILDETSLFGKLIKPTPDLTGWDPLTEDTNLVDSEKVKVYVVDVNTSAITVTIKGTPKQLVDQSGLELVKSIIDAVKEGSKLASLAPQGAESLPGLADLTSLLKAISKEAFQVASAKKHLVTTVNWTGVKYMNGSNPDAPGELIDANGPGNRPGWKKPSDRIDEVEAKKNELLRAYPSDPGPTTDCTGHATGNHSAACKEQKAQREVLRAGIESICAKATELAKKIKDPFAEVMEAIDSPEAYFGKHFITKSDLEVAGREYTIDISFESADKESVGAFVGTASATVVGPDSEEPDFVGAIYPFAMAEQIDRKYTRTDIGGGMERFDFASEKKSQKLELGLGVSWLKPASMGMFNRWGFSVGFANPIEGFKDVSIDRAQFFAGVTFARKPYCFTIAAMQARDLDIAGQVVATGADPTKQFGRRWTLFIGIGIDYKTLTGLGKKDEKKEKK